MPKYISKRYVKAIKEVLNKTFHKTSSVHLQLARLIKSFSHRPVIYDGTYLLNNKLTYFVVQKLLSSHFVLGFFCPARLCYSKDTFWYQPDVIFKSSNRTKKLMDPFSESPYVKERRHLFFLTSKYKHV